MQQSAQQSVTFPALHASHCYLQVDTHLAISTLLEALQQDVLEGTHVKSCLDSISVAQVSICFYVRSPKLMLLLQPHIGALVALSIGTYPQLHVLVVRQNSLPSQ